VLFAGRSDFGRKRVDFARRACELAARQVDGLVFRVCERLEHHLVPIWMNAADLLLLTSLAEGSPNVVKEALACNLPVVATDVGDVREVLDGVERCRVLPIDASVEGFATALVEVLAGAPARCNGRDRTPHLSTEVIGQRLLAIYGAVSSRGMRGVSGASGADNIAQV
jgi:glycosyltransferase involved in cell wall biosynthesis